MFEHGPLSSKKVSVEPTLIKPKEGQIRRLERDRSQMLRGVYNGSLEIHPLSMLSFDCLPERTNLVWISSELPVNSCVDPELAQMQNEAS